jgi:ligand-binding sensor domain-containing protein/class 3 adenylate cyclase
VKKTQASKLKDLLRYLIPFLLLAACTSKPKVEERPSNLWPQAKSVIANKEEGYRINTVSGDSIKPIINSLGDTVVTGFPIPAKGKVISVDSLPQPKSYIIPPREQLEQKIAEPNVHPISEELTIIPIIRDSLKTTLLDEHVQKDRSRFIINNFGDTVFTGIAMPVQAKAVKTFQPKPTPALPLRFKDAANTNLQSLSEDQGIPSPYVYCITEDKSGNLWFGTNGGVCKYDGKSFTSFTEKEGLSSSMVNALTFDRNGNLWIGTSKGVSLYDGKAIMHFTEKEGLVNNNIQCFKEDKEGNIWIGTRFGGVSCYDGKSFTHFTTNEGLAHNNVRSIIEDEVGNIWIGTQGGGLSCFNGNRVDAINNGREMTEDDRQDLKTVNGKLEKSFLNFTVKDGLSDNNVMFIKPGKSGDFWIATWGGGVNYYDGKSFTHFTKKEGLSDNRVWSIAEDKSGNLWFGTLDGGVNRYNGKTFTHFTTKDGLSNNSVNYILEDPSGNLWFATGGGGISRYSEKSFTHYSKKEGLPYSGVFSVAEDQFSNLWFATRGGGLVQFDGNRVDAIRNGEKMTDWDRDNLKMVNGKPVKSFTHFRTKEDLSQSSVKSIIEDQRGNLWLGTQSGGVSRYDGNRVDAISEGREMTEQDRIDLKKVNGKLVKTFTHFTEREGLVSNTITMILEDRAGNLWFATNGGLSRYDGKTFTQFTDKEGLSSNRVLSIIEDNAGKLWIGSFGGVTCYDGKCFTHYTEKEGLANNNVVSIIEDKSGNLWFGTFGGGLSCYDGKSFTHYTEKEGLSNNNVLSLTEDDKGHIWAGTESGLTNISFLEGASANLEEREDNKVLNLIRYKKNDGLRGQEKVDFNRNGVFLDSKNRIWWGSRNLALMDANKFVNEQEPPLVSLRLLDINERFIDFRNLIDSCSGNGISFTGVEHFENYPLNLELDHHKNHLTFHFTAIDWAAPHKIQYSYLMDGLNTKWSKPSSEPKAEYRNLSYGTYTFKIRAIGESGQWSEAFEYTFRIHPPWWQTWWARTGFVILALMLLTAAVRWRTARLKQRQKELEMEVYNATKEIREQKAVVEEQREEAKREHERSEELLLNILPHEVAEELKEYGASEAKHFDEVSILFTDFKGFTTISERLSPKDLVKDLHECFSAFDQISEKSGIEKIKTIGDSYMAASGLPKPNVKHARSIVLAALEMIQFIELGKQAKIKEKLPYFEMRIGIHTGPVVAGIVGVKKFSYDVWGDTVNTASRMESNSEPGKVNISQKTYELLKHDDYFSFEKRGEIKVKGKGEMEMWFVSKA